MICFAICALVSRTHTAEAKPFDIIGSDWEGTADFVRLARDELGDARVKAVDKLELTTLRPIDSVIILHPEKSLDVGSYARFMRDGGRVLLLDDYGSGDGLLEHFNLRRVPAPEDPAATVLDNPQLAVADAEGNHPVVTGVSKVVTNHATGIRHNDLSSLLVIRSVSGKTVNVAVAGMVGKGRFLAVSDPSIVMNRMLRYPGNRAFARGLVDYAGAEDTWGKRDGYVYIVFGAFEQKGSFGEEPGSAEWNERARAVKDALHTMRTEGVPPSVIYAFCVLVGLALVIWVGANAARVHKPVAPRFTRPIPLVAQGGVAGHVAVLSAPGTSRALALLELKSALEERLTALLSLDRVPPADIFMHELGEARLLRPEQLAELRALFTRLAHVETMVLSRRANALGSVTDDEVLKTAETIRRLLSAVESRQAEGMSTSQGSPLASTSMGPLPPV